MADQQASRGRARGRGRGSQQPQTGTVAQQMGQMSIASSPESGEGDNGGNGNGNGNGSSGAAMRGRGGYRAFDPTTRPSNLDKNASIGNKGNPINLIANYFKLQTNPDLHVYQYHATFQPSEIEPKFKRQAIKSHSDLFNDAYIFDGQTTIFSLNDAGEENEFVEQLPEIQARVIIKRTTEVSREPRQSVEMVRVYNTQMRKFMGRYLKLVQIRQYMYSPQQKVNIPEYNISIWPGNVTAVNIHDGGILVCVDPIYKVVRTDNALEILKKLREQYPQQFKEEALKQLTSASVMTAYNNKSYKVEDIDWKARPSHVMAGDDSGRTYVDYYRERYNVKIQDPNQPLLLAKIPLRDLIRMGRRPTESEPARPVLLVPELCLMTGLSEAMMNDFQLKKAMSNHTRPGPTQRIQTVKRFMQALTSNADVQSDMGQWGTRYSADVLQVPGRVLPHELVLGKNEDNSNCNYRYDHKTDDFIAQIRSKPLRSTVQLGNWTIIATERDRENVDQLANTMRRVCQGMQIGVNRPTVKLVANPQTRSFVEECRRVDPNIDMVVVLCPDNKADRYSAIKKLYCCEMGILSQVVLARNVRSKGFMSICTKVALQIACKMGAEAWAMFIPQRDIMVVGFDTYHDVQAAGGPRKSVGGFVCSINPGLTKWYSRVNYHQTTQELSQHFCQNMTAGLQAYYNANGRFPGWVVVYRDGVGEGQINEVHKTERLDIERAIKKADTGTLLTFIVVSKRINTRLFFPRERECMNPPPGTVVDTVITRPTRYEFYLVSQSVRQGTVSPTSFNIIHDDSGKSPNIHQMLAYKMTHMYYNWPGTIRVPAPCQYAHKLALLTGTALHKEPHARLHSKLFYL